MYSLETTEDGGCLWRVEDIVERNHPTVTVVHAEHDLGVCRDVRRSPQKRSLSPVDVQCHLPVLYL